MTFEELKAEAKRQGYTFSRKIVYEKLKNCICSGYRRIFQELSLNPKGKYYRCANCGRKSDIASSWYEARQNWNRRVENEKNKEKRYLNCKYLDAGMDGMLCSMNLCTTCKEFNGEKCSCYTPKNKMKDREKNL